MTHAYWHYQGGPTLCGIASMLSDIELSEYNPDKLKPECRCCLSTNEWKKWGIEVFRRDT